MDITQKKLSNQLKTLFLNSKGASSASVQIWFRAGSALEQKENQGIAHFLEHMFFKGTPKRPGAKIAHEVESFGGEINAFTSFDYTCYYINTPNEHINKTVDILMDMVSHPEFKESELIPERQVVFEEYRRSQDSPNQFNFQNIQNSCFQKGYKHPILGTPKTILNFSREQLIEFRKKFYNTTNAMLVVAGDFNEQKIASQIEKFKMPSGDISKFPSFNLKTKPEINIHHKQVRQASLTFTMQAPDYLTPASAAEDLALNCLAYGETSRLYQELVLDKSLATHISGSTMFFSKNGIHFLKVTFPVESFKKVLATLSSSLKAISKSGFEAHELEKIKNQYIASKVYEQESLEGIAFSLGHGFAQNGNIHCEDKFIDELNKVTLEQTNHALSQIFSKPMHATLQVPEDTKTIELKKQIETFTKNISGYFKVKTPSKVNKKPTSIFDPALTEIEITKGVKFLHRHNPTAPTFVLHAYLKGGLCNETRKNNGLYSLLSKCMTYGYSGVDYETLKKDLANKSASLSGFTGKNAFGLTTHAQSSDFKEILRHFMGTLLKPEFPNKFIEHEKVISHRMITNHQEDPVKQCFHKFSEIIFAGHHYELDMIGSTESLKNISQKSIKKQYSHDLLKSEILVTYCGSQTFDEIYPQVAEYIKNLSPRAITHTPVYKLKKIAAQNAHLEFDREQTQIFMGFPSFAITQKEHLYLKILSAHLSGQSSELFVDVRDRKGLCYAVQPVHFAALEAGYWGVYIGAGNDKTEKAIDAIGSIFSKLQTKGFSQTQLSRVKKMIKGQQQINIQTHNDYAGLYSVALLHGMGVNFPHQQLIEIEKINLTDFNKFLKDFFKVTPVIVTAGPARE